jgi:hypothetical protein
MNVDALSNFFNRAADLMEAAGAKGTPDEVREMARTLGVFGELSLKQFAEFLVKAEAFSRGDLESVFPKPKEKKPRTPKTPKAAPDPEKVPNATRTLQTLYERALDPSVTEASVSNAIEPMEDFKLDELKRIAVDCGFKQKFANKKAVLDALRKWILGRKGAFHRAGS